MIGLEGHPSLVPLGGLFLAIVGLAILAGSPFPRLRQASVWIGLALGAAATIAAGSGTALHYPPTVVQLGSLVIAVTVEIVALVVFMPKLYRAGPRAVTAGTLGIVAAHFVLMVPAFGWWVAALGTLCGVNATVFWWNPHYRTGVAGAADGALKLVFGAAMMASATAAGWLGLVL